MVEGNRALLSTLGDRLRRSATILVVVRLATAVVLAAVAIVGAAGLVAAAPGDTVLVTRVDDPITPVIADHLIDGLEAAEDDGHEAYIVEIDTPGGLSSSMRDIVSAFLGAEVPVVVHVAPSGARAASAGALIAWSAHIVAMAPGTTIGAATPVDLGGGEVSDKIVEDAAAYARAVAEERGRNIEVAETAVTEGRALSASEAVDAGVADLIVEGREDLLASIQGEQVELAGGATVAIDTAGATVVGYDMTWLRSILQFLADPNLAFLFFSIGTLGLIYELASPGIGAGGGLGALLIVLGLVSLSVLPFDAAGLVFFGLAAVLFGVELFAPGIGIAAVLGSVALMLAGIFTFSEDTPGLSLSLAAVIPTVLVVGVAVVVAGRLATSARSAPVVSGPSELVGREVVVEHVDESVRQARIGGSWWRLRSDVPLAVGDHARVVGRDGLELIVEPSSNEEREP